MLKIKLYLCKKTRDDLSESISQGSNREKDTENNRIKKISDDIARRRQLYEAESGDGKKDVRNPQWLTDEIREWHENAVRKYQQKVEH